MYLTKLNPIYGQVEPTDDIYETHQKIWRLFPHTKDRSFLYRVYKNCIYLQSDKEPVDVDNQWVMISKPLNPILRIGALLSFDTLINASVKKMGKRHSIITNTIHNLKRKNIRREDWPCKENILQNATKSWLKIKGNLHGFEINQFQVLARTPLNFYKSPKKDKISFETLRVKGYLTVTNPEAFLEVLSNGLGRKKAFGCGMILIKRATRSALFGKG